MLKLVVHSFAPREILKRVMQTFFFFFLRKASLLLSTLKLLEATMVCVCVCVSVCVWTVVHKPMFVYTSVCVMCSCLILCVYVYMHFIKRLTRDESNMPSSQL